MDSFIRIFMRVPPAKLPDPPPPPPLSDADYELVDDLLEKWEERREAGDDQDGAKLCPERPDLHEFIDKQIRLLKRMDWMNARQAEHRAFVRVWAGSSPN